MTDIVFRRKLIGDPGGAFAMTPSAGPGAPAIIVPTMSGLKLTSLIAREKPQFAAALAAAGAVLFRGFPVHSDADFRSVAEAFAGTLMGYSERSTPRTSTSEGIYTSTEYPADQEIFFHNENSYAANWPGLIFFWCKIPPAAGGRTPMADTRRVLELLPGQIRSAFDRHGVQYRRTFRTGLGLDWRDAFGVEDRDALARKYEPQGYRFDHAPNGTVIATFHTPAIRHHAQSGRPSWFNHVALFHPSGLPEEVRATTQADAMATHAAVDVRLGNGAPVSDAWAATIRKAYRASASAFDWQSGDVVVIDNTIMAHAREPFTAPRAILVAMADPQTHEARE